MPKDAGYIVIIQHQESRLFLQGRAVWTHDARGAMQFEHVDDAVLFVSNHRLAKVDVVMRFGDPKYDVRIKTGPED